VDFTFLSNLLRRGFEIWRVGFGGQNSMAPVPNSGQIRRDGPTCRRSWIGNRAVLSSPGEAGGAFATTDLEAQLKARGVTQVVVTGVVTSGGVEATERQGAGFNVNLALDARTDLREDVHEYSLRNVFPRVGETGCVQEIISRLKRPHERLEGTPEKGALQL